GRLGRRDRVDEALARGADQQRQAEALEFGEAAEADNALLRRLAEADAGVEHDLVAGDTGLRRDLQRAGKEGDHVGDDVDRRIGGVAVVHHDHRHAASGDQRSHGRVALQAPYIVDDPRALVDSPGGDWRLNGVNGDREAELDDLR